MPARRGGEGVSDLVGEEGRERRPVKSAYRALDVLEGLARGPATLSELSRLLDIPKSSLHGLMRTLTDRGWVTATPDGRRFRLGLRALQVGTRFVDEDELVTHVAASLDRLASVTGETVQQARLDGDQIVYLAKRDTTHQVRIISSIGTRLPAHATALGKALLAADPGASARLSPPLAPLTPHTLTDPVGRRGRPGAHPRPWLRDRRRRGRRGVALLRGGGARGSGRRRPDRRDQRLGAVVPPRRRAGVTAGDGVAHRAATPRRALVIESGLRGRGPCPG